MIGQLTGLVIEQNDKDRCLVDVNGVGYVVYASSRTLMRLPRPPEIARVLIETVVRENAILLYGFVDSQEQEWFRLLTTVQGVGVRMAIAILSTLSPEELVSTIMTADKVSLTRASGVGPRLATRIVTELNGKMSLMSDMAAAIPLSDQGRQSAGGSVVSDALLALEGLGFRRIESQPVISRILKRLTTEGGEPSLDLVIREALRELA